MEQPAEPAPPPPSRPQASGVHALPVTTPPPSSRPVAGGFLIAPAAGGWRLLRRDASETARRLEAQAVYPTLLEAWEAAALPAAQGKGGGPLAAFRAVWKAEAQANVGVALPARLAVVEPLHLPSTAREELDGMVPLQMEKTLPYPIEEVLCGFRIVKTEDAPAGDGGEAVAAGGSSVVSVVAMHRPAVEAALAPLLEKGVTPTLSLWGDRLGGALAGSEAACAIWGEGDGVVFAVFGHGAILFLEVLPSVEALLEALPRLRLGAELAGAAGALEACCVDPALIELARLRPVLSERLAIPGEAIRVFSFSAVEERPPLDFTPPVWRQKVAQRTRQQRLIRQIASGALVYVALVALALGGLAWRKAQSRRLEAQLAAIRPQLDSVLALQARWKALAPAIDSRQFTLELLREVVESLPSPDVRVTLLEQSIGQCKIEVEAPTAAAAVEFGERLKAREALGDYKFEAGQPTLTGGDKAQYRIFGKL